MYLLITKVASEIENMGGNIVFDGEPFSTYFVVIFSFQREIRGFVNSLFAHPCSKTKIFFLFSRKMERKEYFVNERCKIISCLYTFLRIKIMRRKSIFFLFHIYTFLSSVTIFA